jgi:hypothetical protein
LWNVADHRVMLDNDVTVIGGSLAGLQAALTLGRARRRVALVDDGRPRNRPAGHVHNFLGQPAPSPAHLLAVARDMVAGYDVVPVDDRVETVTALDDPDPRFEVATRGGGRWISRSIVLATGLTDELPDIPGLAREWGDRVVACPHCHGWEVRDQPLAQLGMRGRPAQSTARAVLLSRWSDDVSLFTDGDELDAPQLARLSAAGVPVRTEPVLAWSATTMAWPSCWRTASGSLDARSSWWSGSTSRPTSPSASAAGWRRTARTPVASPPTAPGAPACRASGPRAPRRYPGCSPSARPGTPARSPSRSTPT